MCYVVELSSLSKVIIFLSPKGERGCVFAVLLAFFPEKGILGFIAQGSIIRVLRCHIPGIRSQYAKTVFGTILV